MTHDWFTADRRGVSPVIGVILMVAITVILAAVIGTFVLGLGDQVGDNAPQASFDFDFEDNENFSITHEGGDKLQSSNIQIVVGDNTSYDNGLDDNWGGDAGGWEADGSITAGDTVSMEGNGVTHDGSTVRVVWSSSSGGDSQTIAKAEWP